MKSDIVNPTPANKAMPNTCFQFTLWGRLAIFNLTNNHVKNMIPTSFPIINPLNIPILIGLTRSVKKFAPI